MQIYDDRNCILGEGALWHPERNTLFWFDILGKTLMTRDQVWSFDEHVSAAGRVDADNLLVASETGLWRFNLETSARELVTPLEADDPVTRSNDGRADPQGGFWIGTMGKHAETQKGAIYRYYKGTLRKLVDKVTVSNAICFAPAGDLAYYADTHAHQIMRQRLDHDGWPDGAPEVHIDMTADGLNPDGSVVDTGGCLWCALWGNSQVACYGPDGAFLHAFSLPASQVTCPAFGGPDLSTLYLTTAGVGLNEAQGGQTFAIPTQSEGQVEHKVIL